MAKTNGNGNGVPEGFTPISGGTLPPFFNLGVGQSLRGILREVRQDIRTKKAKVKGKVTEIEETKMYYSIQLTAEADGDDGSRQHKPLTMEAGKVITLSGSGSIDRGFHLAALKIQGEDLTALPKDSSAWSEAAWSGLYGREFFVRRDEDGKMKRGEFIGNKVKQYLIALSETAPKAVAA